MLPLTLLTQRDALHLAKQASADFPGLPVFLQPIILPRPLTDDLTITGYVLFIAGPRGRTPWFGVRHVLDYEDVYQRVFTHYEALVGEQDADDADEEMPMAQGARCSEAAPQLSVLAGQKAREAP